MLVALLTLNAFALHRLTFPRLARGRSVARWRAGEWIVVAVPVALSNFLWMFTAFLGIARPWNDTVPFADVLVIAAGLYLVVQLGVFAICDSPGGRRRSHQAARRRRAPLARVAGQPRRRPAIRRRRPAEVDGATQVRRGRRGRRRAAFRGATLDRAPAEAGDDDRSAAQAERPRCASSSTGQFRTQRRAGRVGARTAGRAAAAPRPVCRVV